METKPTTQKKNYVIPICNVHKIAVEKGFFNSESRAATNMTIKSVDLN